MEKSITLKELKDANFKRDQEIFKDLHEWDVMHWACALAGEAGELANKAKKIWKLDNRSYNVINDKVLDTVSWNYEYDKYCKEKELLIKSMAEELADVMIYLDLLAQHLEIDLQKALIDKFNSKSEEFKSTIFL